MSCTNTEEAPVKTEEVLEKAAKVLEEHGWCRHSFRNDHGNYCVLGAIHEAVYLVYNSQLPRDKFTFGMKEQIRHMRDAAEGRMAVELGYLVEYWNDDVCKDQDHAIAKLKEASNG